MTKNIVLKSLYTITDQSEEDAQSANMVKHHNAYVRMQDLSKTSLIKNLQGDWQFLELTGVFSDLSSSFIHTFVQTHKIWREHAPCNIFYVDPDILCLDSIDIWDIAPERMWLPDISNCGLRYFHRLMPPIQWSTGYEMLKFWDYTSYSYEQTLYQAMELCFSYGDLSKSYPIVTQYSNYTKKFLEFQDISTPFVHVHASRNPMISLQQLEYLNRQSHAA